MPKKNPPQTIDLRPVSKRKNTFPIRKIIGGGLFAIALVLLVVANWPYLSFLYNKAFDSDTQLDNSSTGISAGAKNSKITPQSLASFSEEEGNSEKNSASTTPDFQPNDEVGYLYIKTPELDIDIPIIEGVEFENLQNGIGHQPGTDLPHSEKGNFVVAGHSWYPGDNPFFTAFYDLEKLTSGQYVTVYYQNQRFIYQINSREIITPDQTEILKSTDAPTITIYTCYPVRTNLKRLVYTGNLIKVEDI